MRNKRICLIIVALLAGAFSSCDKDRPDPAQSVITLDEGPAPTQFDLWLEEQFVQPYNIEFKWRYDYRETNFGFATIPAEYNQSVMLAHLVKYLCIEVYNAAVNRQFTRAYFPKMFYLIGSWEYYNNGTYVMGTAEGGKKILLAGVNELNQHLLSIGEINNYYIKTIHHEFTHILNQTVPYPSEFKEISGSDYVADSWSSTPGWLSKGFITAYAQHSDREDFAETMSTYIINDAATWNTWMNRAGSGALVIQAKLEIVRKYLQDNFNLDLDILRNEIAARQNALSRGQVDLLDIETR